MVKSYHLTWGLNQSELIVRRLLLSVGEFTILLFDSYTESEFGLNSDPEPEPDFHYLIHSRTRIWSEFGQIRSEFGQICSKIWFKLL